MTIDTNVSWLLLLQALVSTIFLIFVFSFITLTGEIIFHIFAITIIPNGFFY